MKIKYSFSFKNIILLLVVIFFTLLLLNTVFSGNEGFSSAIPPPIDDSIKVYPNLTPPFVKMTTPTVKATITSAPTSSSQPSPIITSSSQLPSFNPTCSGNGWSDPNPAANGRHFFCDGNGNYLPAGGFCPANLQNVNGLCVVPSPPTLSAPITTPPAPITTPPSPFTPICSGNGWSDPDPAANGRHFNCDGNGKYLPAGGFCPANYQSVNGVCVDPASITTQPTQQQYCNGDTYSNCVKSNGQEWCSMNCKNIGP